MNVRSPSKKPKAHKKPGLSRSLSPLQVQLLSIGGVIGVGLFYGAGVAVKLAGPAVILDYILGGIIVAIVMRALGEMTVKEPRAGSFSRYAESALGPFYGFLTGGMWWFFWVSTVMSELAAIGLLFQYWDPSFPAWIPGAVALVLFMVTNLFSVKVFGTLEFWFAVLKVSAILLFMGLGLYLAFASFGLGGTHRASFSNLWHYGGFSPFGLGGMMQALSLVVLGYSGVETLAVTAGETRDPDTSIPNAVQNVILRIAILYVGSIFVMLISFPWTALVHHHHASPYVLLFDRLNVPWIASVINAIIISSGLSSSNTGLYGGSRMLFSMARRGDVPKRLANLSKKQVPRLAVILTAAAISLGIVLTYVAPSSVYVWISSAASFGAIWTWGIILVSEIIKRTRSHEDLKYPMPLWPALPVIGLVLLLAIFIGIALSPLTRVSLWTGAAWLVLLAAWWAISGGRKEESEPSKA